MNIEKITKLKSGKYKIKLSLIEIITYPEVIINNNILYKKKIDDFLFKKVNIETKYYDLYYKCIKFIDKRMRSEKEIRNYLLKQEVDEDTLNKIIIELKTKKLINDISFTKSFINDKLYLSNYGLNKIKNELLNNGIDNSVIENELQNIDNTIVNEKLKKLIDKYIRTHKKLSSYQLNQKLLINMISLGYNKSDILSIINKYTFDDNDALTKEYNKLKNKYEGKKLIQKLLSRGFSYESIELKIKENN